MGAKDRHGGVRRPWRREQIDDGAVARHATGAMPDHLATGALEDAQTAAWAHEVARRNRRVVNCFGGHRCARSGECA
jgi:hypothetical protein